MPRQSDRGAWIIVARRDFWVRLRDKGFVISTGITMTVLTVVILLRAFSGATTTPSFDLGVVGSSSVGRAVPAAAETVDVEVDVVAFEGSSEAREALREGRVDAVLEGETLVGLRDVAGQLQQVVQAAAIGVRIQEALDTYDVPPEVQEGLGDQAPVQVAALEPGDPNRLRNGGIAFIGVILLYGQLFGYGVWIATGVIEEKSSRVVELLLAAIRPRQLMAGKIVGIGLLGLAQLIAIAAYAITLASLTGAIDLPLDAIGAALLVIGWFVLGFAFYASLFAVAGSLVSRMEELQNALVPINLVVFGSFFVSIGALADPEGTLPRVASLLPMSSALAMPVRIVLGAAGPAEIALSIAIVVGSTLALIPLAARIYSAAVLRTGAKVKLREAWRAAP